MGLVHQLLQIGHDRCNILGNLGKHIIQQLSVLTLAPRAFRLRHIRPVLRELQFWNDYWTADGYGGYRVYVHWVVGCEWQCSLHRHDEPVRIILPRGQ